MFLLVGRLSLELLTEPRLLQLEFKPLELILGHGDLAEGFPDLLPPVFEVHGRLLADSPGADVV